MVRAEGEGRSFLTHLVIIIPLCLIHEQDMTVAELIEKLGADDPKERESATGALLLLGSPALEELERRRDDPDPERRERIRLLLRKLDSTYCLMDDLRSDDMPRNATRARKLLFQRMKSEPDKTANLLAGAAQGSNPQAVITAAYILWHSGRRDLLQNVRPDLFGWSLKQLIAGRLDDVEWIAADLVLGLWRTKTEHQVEEAFAEALRGKRPLAAVPLQGVLSRAFRERFEGFKDLKPNESVGEFLRGRGLHFPASLVRMLIENLRDDPQWNNADLAERYLRELGDVARGELIAALDDLDDQGTRLALGLLKPALVSPFPDSVLKGLARRPEMGVPPDADRARWVPHLLQAAGPHVDRRNLMRIAHIARINRNAGRDRLLPLALKALASDNRDGNAAQAVESLAAWGDPEPLMPFLSSDDPQVAVAAYVALGRIGRLPSEPPRQAIRELLSQSGSCDDEWRCVLEGLHYLGAEKENLLKDRALFQSWKLDEIARWKPGGTRF